MKNLKSLVHTTHSELKKTIPTIKKSHLYEGIASYCGFRSYAAFHASSFFDKTQITDDERAKGQCFERLLEIGFNAEDALVISLTMTNLWENLSDRRVDDIWHFYLNTDFEERLSSSDILNIIKSLIAKGDLEAKLIGLVLTTEVLVEYKEDPNNRSGEYWHNKRLENHKLNDLQAEVADNYLHTQCYREFLEFLYSDLINSGHVILPSPSALKSFSSKFNVDSNKEWTEYFSEAPYLVTDSLEYIEHYRDTNTPAVPSSLFLDWYKAEVMLNPSKEMVADVIENTSSHEEKWFWYYVGLLYDFDVTEDAHIAINSDTGEEYDGYGPAVVGGYSGISLPEISASSKANMKISATDIFS